MIVLDTNVLSEIFRPRPAKEVKDWLDAQLRVDTFVTAITEAEIFRGIELMPAGRRRDDLQFVAADYFAKEFTGRVLSFDSTASRHYAQIAASRKRIGRPILEFDAQIAAIARAHKAMLATRNTKDFEQCGIQLFDPWKHR